MEEYNKSFKYWKTQEVEEVFGLRDKKKCQRLDNWLKAACSITKAEQAQLDFLQQRLIDKVSYWNEAAIKFYFLGQLMTLVNYDTERYNSFLEPSLSLKLENGQVISGNIDFLVATGKQIPRTPFFTFHEYKPEPKTSVDPMGQLLMAMIAAQKVNKTKGHDFPLYGVYTLGRFWFFVVLEGNAYCKSLAYDATQKDLKDIFCILRKVKDYIEEQL